MEGPPERRPPIRGTFDNAATGAPPILSAMVVAVFTAPPMLLLATLTAEDTPDDALSIPDDATAVAVLIADVPVLTAVVAAVLGADVADFTAEFAVLIAVAAAFWAVVIILAMDQPIIYTNRYNYWISPKGESGRYLGMYSPATLAIGVSSWGTKATVLFPAMVTGFSTIDPRTAVSASAMIK